MAFPVRSCALVGRFGDPRVAETAATLLPYLAGRGVQVLVSDEAAPTAARGLTRSGLATPNTGSDGRGPMQAATPAAPEPNSTGGNGGGWPTASAGTGSATTGDGTVSNCRAGAAAAS